MDRNRESVPDSWSLGKRKSTKSDYWTLFRKMVL